MRAKLSSAIAFLLSFTLVEAAVLVVPSEYATIQSALDATVPGDTVVVLVGEYREILQMPLHEATLAGEYILSGDSADVDSVIIRPPLFSAARTVTAESGPQITPFHVMGLTIRGSGNGEVVGGGILSNIRDVYVERCRIDSCFGFWGGALQASGGTVNIRACKIADCGANDRGMGLHLTDCITLVDSSSFSNCFSNEGPGENTFFVERGQFTLRNTLMQGSGWDIAPGSTGIRQLGIVDSIVVVGCTIRNNRFHNFFRLPGEGVMQYSTIRFDSNTVESNEFQDNLFLSSDADTGSVARFCYNVFTDNHRLDDPRWVSRMLFEFWGNTQRCYIAHNVFADNESQENSVGTLSDANPAYLIFERNYLFNNACDGFANPPGGVIMMISGLPDAIRLNIISGSQGYAAFQGLWSFPHSYPLVNYWGDSTGPYQIDENPFGQGDSVEDLVHVTPWSADTLFQTPAGEWRAAPSDFALGFPYPNPFNSTVTIEYALARPREVELAIYDVLGKQVTTLFTGERAPGVHQEKWSADGLPSGLYFARLSAVGDVTLSHTVKLLLLK